MICLLRGWSLILTVISGSALKIPMNFFGSDCLSIATNNGTQPVLLSKHQSTQSAPLSLVN